MHASRYSLHTMLLQRDGNLVVGISVIIPMIRYDHWLDEAVNSILNQQDVTVQVVVVHDGVEPKPSVSWHSDPRVTIVHSEQRVGQAAGMNLGVQHAQHELIARLDSDDLSSPQRLAAQVKLMDSTPTAVANGTRVMRIDDKSSETSELRYPVGTDVRKNLILQNVIPHSSLLMRKEAFIKAGGYDASIHQMEDYEFILRLALQGPIGNVDEILTYYRVHPGQISRGAPPSGSHINKVILARKVLSKQLGVSYFSFFSKALLWRAVQFMRYYKIVKPGYERNP